MQLHKLACTAVFYGPLCPSPSLGACFQAEAKHEQVQRADLLKSNGQGEGFGMDLQHKLFALLSVCKGALE